MEKKAKESDLIHREGVTLINIECPSCGAHLYEFEKVYYRNGIALKGVFCQTCEFQNGERMVAGE